MPRLVSDGQDIDDALASAIAAGSSASPVFGDGSLGDVVINTLVETSGDLHYNSLDIQAAGSLVATVRRKLVVRSVGNVTVSGALHADGRGFAGTAGGAGAPGDGATAGSASPTPTATWAQAITGGASGGGGGSAASSGGGSGNALDQTIHRANFTDLTTPPVVTGGSPGNPGGAGNSPAAVSADEASRLLGDHGLGYRAISPLGRGGTGGGGGGSSLNTGQIAVAGGAAGLQSGANVGHGSNGLTSNPGGGGSGGGGGAGGGYVELWCGGDLVIGGSGRISANGGNGGAGGGASAAANFPGDGGGGGGGGGGFVGVFYAGTLTNSGSITASAGAVGTGGPGAGGTIAGGNSGTAGAGVTAVIKVAP